MVAVVAAGTYLARALPLLWTLRARGRRGRGQEAPGGAGTASRDAFGPPAPEWAELMGPSVMAALLVGALLPSPWELTALPVLLQRLLAVAVTWEVARRCGHLGLTVIAGMACAWLLSLIV